MSTLNDVGSWDPVLAFLARKKNVSFYFDEIQSRPK